MSRRTAAGLLALGLAVAFVVVALSRPVDYVKFSPGPTMNILGSYDGEEIVQVSGRRTYETKGALRMVTVYESGPERKVSLLGVVSGWLDPDVALLPKSMIYDPEETADSNRQQSAAQMTSSQDNAIAAALEALDIEVGSQVTVSTVEPEGPSVGKLEPGDVLVAIDGRRVEDSNGLVELIRAVPPGTDLTVTVLREGARRDVVVTTQASPDNPRQSRIGVNIGSTFRFPFDVDITLPDTVGGPSAGMIFALTVYDVLTPGALTGGGQIAGSGTIGADGVVGAIGGIAQKLPAAQRDGAEIFLVAADNCADALRAHYDPDRMRLVKVQTLSDAIEDIETWRKNPDAALPECTR